MRPNQAVSCISEVQPPQSVWRADGLAKELPWELFPQVAHWDYGSLAKLPWTGMACTASHATLCARCGTKRLESSAFADDRDPLPLLLCCYHSVCFCLVALNFVISIRSAKAGLAAIAFPPLPILFLPVLQSCPSFALLSEHHRPRWLLSQERKW